MSDGYGTVAVYVECKKCGSDRHFDIKAGEQLPHLRCKECKISMCVTHVVIGVTLSDD